MKPMGDYIRGKVRALFPDTEGWTEDQWQAAISTNENSRASVEQIDAALSQLRRSVRWKEPPPGDVFRAVRDLDPAHHPGKPRERKPSYSPEDEARDAEYRAQARAWWNAMDDAQRSDLWREWMGCASMAERQLCKWKGGDLGLFALLGIYGWYRNGKPAEPIL